jgi:hypothetical protein
VLEAAEGQEAYMIFQDSLQISKSDRGLLKMMAEHLKRERKAGERS